MKIINLGRGQGKTTRLLYASEFNDIPILCSSLKQKDCLLHMAKKLHLNIPEPLCVCDVFSDKIRGNRSLENGILVDDTESVLQQMLHNIGLHSEIKAMSVTDEKAEPMKISLWDARDMVCPDGYYTDMGRA